MQSYLPSFCRKKAKKKRTQKSQSADLESIEAVPPPAKRPHGGVLFTGSINQLIVVNSLDALSSFKK